MKLLQTYSELMNSGIYCIENQLSKKKYIGSSNCVYHRLKRHLCDLKFKRHGNPILQASFNKNGPEAFVAYIVEFCPKDRLIEREEFFIETEKPYFNVVKLNLKKIILSEKSKKQISETLKRRHKAGEITTFKNPQTQVRVKAYTLRGEFINLYPSIGECARDLGLYTTSVSRCIKKQVRQNNGFQFFKEEDDSFVEDITQKHFTATGVIVYDLKENKTLKFLKTGDMLTALNIASSTYSRLKNTGKIWNDRYYFIYFQVR